MRAAYRINTAKIAEVVLWLLERDPDLDIYHLVKCAFFADKWHLNAYGRPVTGDQYVADTYGPRGKVLYGLLRAEPFELLALGGNGAAPFKARGKWHFKAARGPNLRLLSASDRDALEAAYQAWGRLSFKDLVDIAHDDPAWIEAAPGGAMRPELLIDDEERRAAAKESLYGPGELAF